MQLSSEIFTEVTGICVIPVPGDSSETDRRRSHRFSLGSRATIRPARKGGEAQTSVVMLRDISVESIGFLHAEQIRIGEVFIIQLTGDDGRLYDIQCTCRRCEPGGTGATQWTIGATFEQILAVIEPQAQQPQKSAQPVVAASTAFTGAGNIFAKKPIAKPAAEAPAATAPIVAAPAAPAPIAHSEVHAGQPQPAPVTPAAPSVSPVATTPTATPQPVSAPLPNAAPVAAAVQETPINRQEVTTFSEQSDFDADSFPSREVDMTSAIMDASVVASTVAQPAPDFNPSPVAPAAPAPQYTPKPVENVAQPAPHPGPVATGHNQEVLAKVKAALLNQNQTLQNHAHQLDASQRRITEQTNALQTVTQQRDELSQKYSRAQQEVNESKVSSARKAHELEQKLAELNQVLAQLQAKSESDDKAIAELAELLMAASGATAAAATH